MSDCDDLPELVCFNKPKVERLQEGLERPEDLEAMARALKVAGHPGRLAVLKLLAREECCVCDVAHTLGQPISTASQHLRKLKDAGLLVSRREGKLVIYALNGSPMTALVTGNGSMENAS